MGVNVKVGFEQVKLMSAFKEITPCYLEEMLSHKKNMKANSVFYEREYKRKRIQTF